MINLPSSLEPISPIEQLAPGLIRQCYANRQIVTYTLRDASHQTLDTWHAASKAYAPLWKPGQRVLALYEFAEANIVRSAYAQDRGGQLRKMRPDLEASAAFVLPNTMQGRMAGQTLKIIVYFMRHSGAEARVFYSRVEALMWLKTFLPAAREPAKALEVQKIG